MKSSMLVNITSSQIGALGRTSKAYPLAIEIYSKFLASWISRAVQPWFASRNAVSAGYSLASIQRFPQKKQILFS
jgi:hypothetical protein